jgi:DNA repair protein RecN (Recombination protein N)
MLRKLNVRNFALIRNADLEFKEGYSVITGETGSGKSILLGALQLILGERADYSVIRDTTSKTIVEATFDLCRTDLITFFKDHDLDFADETIIRREINAQGKSRAFINDTPVQLSLLKSLTERLIHIHSQHHTLDLKSRDFQLSLLDVLADAIELRKECEQAFFKWTSKRKELLKAQDEIMLARREHEFNSFLLEELDALKLDEFDFQRIETDVNRGQQAGEIVRSFGQLVDLISGDDGVSSQLARLMKMNTYGDQDLEALIERLQTVRVELNDISDTAADCMESVSLSPEEMAEKSTLLSQFNSLLMKHGCQFQEQLIAFRNDLQDKVTKVESGDEQIAQLETDTQEAEQYYFEKADALSSQRQKHANEISNQIIQLLQKVKLETANFAFDLQLGSPSISGIDEVAVLFSANKGMALQPLEKVASGGELSRLMLVIHYLLSGKKQLPTVIFDEIDTGVSGEVAQRIGELLKMMGDQMQLIAITHLPQVAAKGGHHYQVSKFEDTIGETITQIVELNNDEKVMEVARLMSGTSVNTAAIENAKNLMN